MSTTPAIFLSPHLDDAVLSCGGWIDQLTRTARPVQVITVFAGDPPPGRLSSFAQSLHARWQSDPAARRAEDVDALQLLGARATHWPHPDAIYRRHPDTGEALYASEESIFGAIAEAESALVESIAERLRSVAPGGLLVTPLAAGGHVDHQVVRRAAETLGRELVYYEDYPYAETPEKLQAVLRSGAWVSDLIRLDDRAIDAKARAILAYRSQRSTFFKDDAEVERRVRTYANFVSDGSGPVERVWRPGEGGGRLPRALRVI